MRLTSTEPVREHLDMLQAAGLGTRRVAELAGLSRSCVLRVRTLSGMFPFAASRILAVQPQNILPVNMVDPTGTRRRSHALVAAGWSLRSQARHIGVAADVVSESLRRPLITAESADRAKRAYDELSMVTPAPQLAVRPKALARRRHWFPPLAWDDETIDDPDTLPCIIPPVEPVSRDLELLVQHTAAGHPVDVTPEARREIVRRLPDAPAVEAARFAQCALTYVYAIRRALAASC
jgi:hypothetical protein